MSKEELVTLLKTLGIPVEEGIQNDKNTNSFPRIVFWEYVWDPILASDQEYDTKVTYQVSFFSKQPRDPKLIELKKKLKGKKLFPYIEHEFVDKGQYFHSYFSVEVTENIE